MHSIIKKYPVVAILRDTPDDDLSPYARSLYDGGIRAFEVSFSAKNAAKQLAWMKEHLPEDTCIGAGTIIDQSKAREALRAGADFFLSPSSDTEILDYCRTNNIPLLPGVFSPSDISLCLSYGYHTLKLFPAGELPARYIKSLKGPFPDAEFVAVGGISPENTASYLKSGFAGVGIGSSLVDKSKFAEKKWGQITEDIQTFLDSLKKEKLI